MQAITQYGAQALTVGASAYLLSKVLGGSGSSEELGSGIDAAAAIALGSVAGSLLAAVAHDYVLPHLPQSDKLTTIESAALNIGASAGGAIALIYLMDGSAAASHWMPIATYAVAGEIAGNYLYGQFVNPALGSFYNWSK
jgi:hypothetical protein